MFNIPKFENSTFYIDQCMKSMHDFAQKERDSIQIRFSRTVSTARKSKEEVNLNKRKDLELSKIRYLNESINRQIKKLLKRFPNFKKIDQIYIDLINTSETNVIKIDDAIGRLYWIRNTADEYTKNFEFKIKKARTGETTGFLMKKYLGKVNSLYRKNKSFFQTLDDARKFMNKLPTFLDIYTISIAGFPNVGKSTLMKKVTGSNVEIQNYPFTTKGLMFGYLELNNNKVIQLIDTPGLLGREKNNSIEQRAQLIVNKYSDEIIFVLDITESCGFNIKQQLKLLKEINNSKTNKKLTLYLSKTDIYNEEDLELKEEITSKIKKYTQFEDSNKLKEFILDNYAKSLSKFDPKKVNLIK